MSKIQGYSFPDSNLKGEMRSALVKQLYEPFTEKKKINCFTLPADNLIFESMLIEEFGRKVKFKGVEKNEKTYKTAQKIIKASKVPMQLENCMDTEFWDKTNDVFDFVWLDYCGAWSPAKYKVMSQLATGNNLRVTKKHPGLVALTVINGMDFLSINELKLIIDKDRRKNGWGQDQLEFKARIGGIPLAVNHEAQKSGYTLMPRMIYRYQDRLRTAKAIPMLMFMFEVQKGINKYDVWSTPFVDMKSKKIGDV